MSIQQKLIVFLFSLQLYLNPYDAQTLCEPCAEVDTDLSDYTDDGDEVPVVWIFNSLSVLSIQ